MLKFAAVKLPCCNAAVQAEAADEIASNAAAAAGFPPRRPK
jgi:hypothetical protein